MEEAKIQLKKVRFPYSTIRANKFIDAEKIEISMKLNHSVAFNDEDKRSFYTKINVSVITNLQIVISVSCVALFTTNIDIDDEFKKSDFVNLNAPAIVYPFVRSFISTMTVNAGYPAIIIPTVNFAAQKRFNKKDVDKQDKEE